MTARLLQLGYTRPVDNGHGSGTYARWGLVPCTDAGQVLARYRDGKPRPIGRPVSGKVAPQWLRAAEAFIKRAGPLTMEELVYVVDWYWTRKPGEPDLSLVEVPF